MNYYSYSSFLIKKYGEKVYKLPINLPVTCPNRDGTKGYCGCTFCSESGTGFESLDKMIPVKEQLSINREYMGRVYKAKKYIAYLQNYTNTYLPVKDFEKILHNCLEDDIVEISISTRPDCVADEYLKAASGLGVEIAFELGLQSVNNITLKKINRGHTLEDYIDCVKRIKSYGFMVGTHLIPNLPYDSDCDIVAAAKLLSDLDTDTVKLHNLFLIDGTPMAKDYKAGKFQIIAYEEYFKRVGHFLQNLSPNIAIERFFARCPEAGCVFSNWGRSWRFLQNELNTYLLQNNIKQSSLYKFE